VFIETDFVQTQSSTSSDFLLVFVALEPSWWLFHSMFDFIFTSFLDILANRGLHENSPHLRSRL